MSDAKRRMNRLLKGYRKWLEGTGPEVFNGGMEWLNLDLEEGSLPALRSMKSSLGDLACYYGTRGVVNLAKSGVDPWGDIYLSGAFHLHELRLRFALWSRLGDEPGFTLEISKWLAR